MLLRQRMEGINAFLFRIKYRLIDSSVPISLQINFCAASMMQSFSQASFDSNRCWSSFLRIYISLCSHGSSVTSSIISDCWRRFPIWIFCLCFQNARSIINQLYFRFAINNQTERQSFFLIALLTHSITPLQEPKNFDNFFTLTFILLARLGRFWKTFSGKLI